MNRANTGPVVSVVIIFLNAARFIEEAVQSVFAQTYSAWELLFVNDGSNDASPAIAHSFAERHPDRVRYLEHEGGENRGMSASRNLGIEHARGRYIAFLDADDAWFPHALRDQVSILDAFPQAAMVYGPLRWWYSWTGEPEDMGRDHTEKLGVSADTLIDPPRLLCRFLQNKAAVPSGILVQRRAIEKYGAFEDAFRGEYEDQVFLAKLCLRAPVFASSQCWYRYRQHPDACVSIGHATGQTLIARQVFLDWLANYLSEQGVRHWGVWWSLRQEYWRYSHPGLFYFLRRNRRRFQRFSEYLDGGEGKQRRLWRLFQA